MGYLRFFLKHYPGHHQTATSCVVEERWQTLQILQPSSIGATLPALTSCLRWNWLALTYSSATGVSQSASTDPLRVSLVLLKPPSFATAQLRCNGLCSTMEGGISYDNDCMVKITLHVSKPCWPFPYQSQIHHLSTCTSFSTETVAEDTRYISNYVYFSFSTKGK